MTRVEQLRPDSELARQHAAHLERLRRNFRGEAPAPAASVMPEASAAPDRTVRVATNTPPVRVLIPTAEVPSAPLAVPSIEVVTKSLSASMPNTLLARKPSVDLIVRVGCKHFGITKAELLADRRTKPLVRWRQIIIFIIKEFTLRSLPEIGRRIGGRDHTTILHAIRQIEGMVAAGDRSIVDHVKALRAEVSAEMSRQYAAPSEVSEEACAEQQTSDGSIDNGTSGDAV